MQLGPLVRRIMLEPAWAAWSGSPLREYWRALEKTQYLSQDEIMEQQLQKLKNLLAYAYEFNSYYKKVFRDAGFYPQDFKSLGDLAGLPVLTKEDIRQNMDSLISDGFDKSSLCEAKTGGSTGKSVRIYFTEDCSVFRNACERRHDRWSGWEVGEPRALVWGNPQYPAGLKNRLKSALLFPVIILDTMEITRGSIELFALSWSRLSPSMLFGHAHSLYLLAKAILEHGIDGIKPKAIISSSMTLLPTERELIERVFGLKVFDRYGCEEVGLIASECEIHKGYHLNYDNIHIEFLKDNVNQALPGNYGRIVVTDLTNMAMPFIRYQIEDMGIPGAGRCACGRNLPLMSEVSGRIADFLLRRDGAKIAGISLIENTLTKFPGIEQMQIIQDNMQSLTLNIVRGHECSDGHLNDLSSFLRKIFGANINIRFNFQSEIKPEHNGKYRFSICRINPNPR